MYAQTQKALSILLLTSMLLQSCGGNLMLGEQRMREQPQEPTDQAPLPDAALTLAPKTPQAADSLPKALAPPPYTARSAWKAQQQRRGHPLPLDRQGKLPGGGGGSDDEGAREEKQSGPPPHATQNGAGEEKASPSPTRGAPSKRGARTARSRSTSPRASQRSPLAANTDKAKAIAHFKGEDAAGIDLRLYESRYSQTTLKYLASTLAEPHSHALQVVLHECNPLAPQTSFVEQVKQLKLLRNSTGKQTVLFISKEPGAGAHHFLFWILHEQTLILFNPVGKSMHADLAAGLSAVKEQGLAREIYVSTTQIQREIAELVSCGPICAELLLHYGAMDQAAFAQTMRSLLRASKAPRGRNRPYDKEVEVSHFLPPSLYRLLEMRGNYPKRVAILRESHLRRLDHAASSLREERPEQVCFNRLMTEEGGFLALEQSEAYRQPQGPGARPSAPLGGPDSDEEAKALPAPTTPLTRPAPLHALPPQHAPLKHASAPGAVFSPLPSSPRMASKAQQLVQSIEKYCKTLRACSGPWAEPDTGQKLLAALKELIDHEQLTTSNEPQAQLWLEALNSDPAIRWSPEQHKELATLLEQVYARALRPLAQAYQHSAAPDCIQPLITQLAQMAALRQARAQREADRSFFTDAATLYQHVLTLCNRERARLGDVTYQNCTEDAYQHLLQIKAALLGRPGDTLEKAALIEEIEKDKRVLHDLRERVRLRVEALSDKALDEPCVYVEESQTLFQDIAQGIRDFLGSRYEDYEKELGAAPCRYAVIGLGSMALSQMTPYSDLEFAIVLEEQATQQAYDYLCRLSHLVHLSVINLGETVMRRSEYGIDFEALGRRGLNFDIGGKTPLGRKDRPYTLIRSVEGLMHYLRNEDHQSERLDKGLPMILESTCYVYGHQPLHQAYEEQKTAWLLQAPVCQARARQALVEGTLELDYTQSGGPLSSRHRPGNLTDFVPKLEEDDMGRVYNVKQELYRLPDRLLHQLALYHGYAASSGWNAIEQLLGGGILNEEAAQHLRYAMSFATMLRLSTYLHHRRQQETLVVLSPVPTASQAFTLPPAALRDEGTLFQYYYAALPLHERLATFFKEKEEGRLQGRLQEVGFFQESSFYQADAMVKGAIHERLGNYARALECYKEAYALYEAQHGKELAQCLLQKGRVQAALGLFEESLACYERALTIYQDLYRGEDDPHKADCLDCVGMAYQALDNNQQALARFQAGLAMRQRWYGAQPHAALARSLHHVGEAHRAMGNKEQGLQHLEQASKMYRALYPEQPHPALARALLSVGAAHEARRDRAQGQRCKEEALGMLEALYPEQDHPWLAEALDAVGSAYQSVGEVEALQRALDYKEAALSMRQRLYGAQAHPLLAHSLSAVGESYGLLGGLRKGLQYQKEGLAMLEGLGRDQVMHGFLVPVHLALGRTYLKLSETSKGLFHFEQAQRLYEAHYATQPSEALAKVHEGLAKAYEDLDDRRQSVYHNEIALRVRRSLMEGHRDRPAPRQGLLPRVALLSHIALGKLKDYVAREAEQMQLVEHLKRDGVCVIAGHGGAGKSTLAAQYAHQEKAQHRTVYWLSAETCGKLLEGMEQLAQDLGIDYHTLAKEYKQETPKVYLQRLCRQVYQQLQQEDLLLVLDNAEEETKEWIETGLIDRPHSVQVIITSRDAERFSNYDPVTLVAFSQEEAQQYLQQRFEKASPRRSDDEQEQLIEAVGCIPHRLALASGYLLQHKTIKVARYLEKIASYQPVRDHQEHSVIPEVRLGLETLPAAAQALVRYGSYVDPDYIPLSFLREVACIEDEELMDDMVSALSRLSLVTVDLDGEGIQIHREVQKACRQYGEWKEDIAMEEQEVYTRLIGVLLEKIPEGASASSDEKAQRIRYAPHAHKVAELAYDMPDPRHDVAILLNRLGHFSIKDRYNFQQALTYHKQALNLYQSLHSHQDHPEVAYTLSLVGSICSQLSHYQEALQYKHEALGMRQRISDQDHTETALVLNSVGELYWHLGHYHQALDYAQQGLEMRKRLFGDEDHKDIARSLNNVGINQEQLGEYKRALAHKQEALAMRRRIFEGKDHGDVAHSLNNVGETLIKLGSVGEGIEMCREALSMRRNVYGAGQDHPYVAVALNSLGVGLTAQGHAADGRTSSQDALSMLNRAYPARDHAYKALCLNNIGISAAHLGELEAGVEACNQGIAMLQRLFRDPEDMEGETAHPRLACLYNNLGTIYERQGEIAMAQEQYQKALAMLRQLFGEHPHVHRVACNLERLSETRQAQKQAEGDPVTLLLD